jgi:1,4-dihydroxy-2-naphthoyl-CoA synthase
MSMLKPSKEDGILSCNKIDKLLVRPSGYEWQEGGGRKGCSDGDGDGIDGGNDVDLTAVEDLYRSSALGNSAQDVAYLWRNIPVPVIAVLDGICFGGGLQNCIMC